MPSINGEPITLREVYSLIEKIETKLSSEIQQVETMVEAKLIAHQSTHDREYERRSSYTRWAVTSILSGLGVLIAIYLAVRGG